MMAVTRLELDTEHARRLNEISEARGSTAEAVLVDLIDRAYAEESRSRRRELVAEIGAIEIEEPPDPATMSEQLAEAHCRAHLP
jgi:hypothetical protein